MIDRWQCTSDGMKQKDDGVWVPVCQYDLALARIKQYEAAAEEVLQAYMPQFNDSRAVDDCLVGLAMAVAGIDATQSDAGTEHG